MVNDGCRWIMVKTFNKLIVYNQKTILLVSIYDVHSKPLKQ